jgi:hypothetical protein
MKSTDPPPALWVVIDDQGLPGFSAPWPEACHEHINDALQDQNHAEAAEWRVRLYFLAEVQPT